MVDRFAEGVEQMNTVHTIEYRDKQLQSGNFILYKKYCQSSMDVFRIISMMS